MRYSDWSISLKLIVIMVVLGVIAAGSIGTISGLISKNAIDANMVEHYSSVRDIRAEEMTAWFQERVAALQVFSGSNDVSGMYMPLLQYHKDNHVGANDEFPVDTAEYAAIWGEGGRIVEFMNAYGYYDIFIICKAHGHVMYSAAKEGDLGGNCGAGSLQSTHLAECWENVCSTGDVYLTDTKPYAPSGGIPAQFIGGPISIDGEFIGVLVFQIPQEAIDGIVQSDLGMGETGETYLIGSDKLMRSNSRLVTDDTVLIQECDQDYVALGLDGKEGTDLHARDYDDMETLTAYGFVDLPGGLRWALVSEIYKSEAYAPIKTMVMMIVGSVILISILIAIIALFFGRSIGNPLSRLANSCGVMADGDFTEALTKSTTKDEIGQMLRGFTGMQENTADLIRQVGDAATNLASSSEELSANADETGRAVQDVARTVEEVAKGSAETNSNVENVAAAIVEAASQGDEGIKFANETNQIMQRATTSIDSTATVISALGEKTAKIEEFSGIITGIADQTNLLALNAAIEAARAGEAGRGFAVVAEEVRKLAEESNNAAGNITQMITGIKSEMQVALEAMDSSKGEVTEGAMMVKQTSEMLAEIVQGVSNLSGQVDAIAAIATENSAAAEEVSSTTEEQTAAMEEIGASSNTLAGLAQDLNKLVEKFKV